MVGQSPHEVFSEATRIRVGEVFGYFEEFDRCLDSFDVQIGKGSHRLWTKASFYNRVCKSGWTIRKAWKAGRAPPDETKGDPIGPSNEDSGTYNNDPVGPDGDNGKENLHVGKENDDPILVVLPRVGEEEVHEVLTTILERDFNVVLAIAWASSSLGKCEADTDHWNTLPRPPRRLANRPTMCHLCEYGY